MTDSALLHSSFPLGLPITQGVIVLQPRQLEVLLQQVAREAVAQALSALPKTSTPKPAELPAARSELPTREAAVYMGVTPGTLLEFHKQGLRFRKGRPNHYRIDDLEAFKSGRIIHYSPT